MEDTEVGGHSVGVWYVPMFTTWNITPMGITTVSLWLQLYWFRPVKPNSRWFTAAWYRCLSVYIQYLCKWLHVGVCVYTTEVHYALILMLLTLLLFSMFLLQSHTPCITPLFVCFLEFVCRMSFADVPDQTVLTICAVERSQLRCWLFSSLLYSGFWEAGGSCVWVIFLHPRAQTIWSAPDMVISVSDSGSCATVLCI